MNYKNEAVDCISIGISFLVVLLYRARCYHWRKLGKGYLRPLFYFLKLHVNESTVISK